MTSFRILASNRDFTALWSAATVGELGTRASVFVMPLVAYAISGSTLWASVAGASYLIGMVATLLPGGVIADRVNRRRLMRWAYGSGALMYLSLAVAGIAGALTLPHLLLGALATGVASGLFEPAENAAVRDIVSDEELPTALSQSQARQHVAGLLGGPVGGALYGLTRWAPFAANAVAYAVGWLLLGRIRGDLTPQRDGEPAHPVTELTDGIRFTWDRPFFRILLIWAPLINLTINALFFLAILRLIEAGFPGWQLGLVEAAVGVIGILGALAAPRLIERFRTGNLAIVTAWIWVPAGIPLALWNHPVAIVAAISVGMFFNPAGNAGIGAYRTAITPPELLGRVASADKFVSLTSMPLAPLLAGALLGTFGSTTAVLILAAFAAGVALIPTLSTSIKSVPRPDVWRADLVKERAAVPSGG